MHNSNGSLSTGSLPPIKDSEFPLVGNDGLVHSQPIVVSPCDEVWVTAYGICEDDRICLYYYLPSAHCLPNGDHIDARMQPVTTGNGCAESGDSVSIMCLCDNNPRVCLSDFGPGSYILCRTVEAEDVTLQVARYSNCQRTG